MESFAWKMESNFFRAVYIAVSGLERNSSVLL